MSNLIQAAIPFLSISAAEEYARKKYICPDFSAFFKVSNQSSRLIFVSCFESLSGGNFSLEKVFLSFCESFRFISYAIAETQTATGPANGPRPTSSTPMSHLNLFCILLAGMRALYMMRGRCIKVLREMPCAASSGERVDKTQTALCFVRSVGIAVVSLRTGYRRHPVNRQGCVHFSQCFYTPVC